MGAPIIRGGSGGPPWGHGAIGQIYAPDDRNPWIRVPGPSGSGARWRPLRVAGSGLQVNEDFLLDASGTLPAPWGKQDTSAAGSPTTDYVADAAGGTYVMSLATNTEVEALTLYFADQLVIDMARKPIFGCRIKVSSDQTGGGGLFAAGDKLVMGLASARNATLDNIAINAWFLFAGANHNIYVETDDGTTDNDDNDTTVDWAEDTYVDLVVDCSDLSNIRFIINDANHTPEAMTLAAVSGNVQPYIELAKASAANKDHKITIQHVWVDTANSS